MKHIFNICLLLLIGVATTAYADTTISDNMLGLNQSLELSQSATAGTLIVMQIPTDGIVPPSPSAPAGQDVRLVTVYLPPNYANSTDSYPVVYYCPGLGGTNVNYTVTNAAILDDLISSGQIVPMIVVNVDPSLIIGPTDNTPGYIPDTYVYLGSWYVNSALNGQFETFMVENTVNFIDANFRTKAERAYRAIAGQSMGAYGSLYLGMTHPETYIGFGCESATAFWADATTNLAREPDGALFSINSLIQPEIPTTGPGAGKIAPTNGGGGTPTEQSGTFSFFSYSAAFSPDLDAIAGHPANPFQGTYFVDLPFLVNGDGTPVYGPPIPYIGANPLPPGNPVVFPNGSLVLDQEVIDRWITHDPYHLIDANIPTLKTQAFYLDAGDVELIDNRGARLISEKLADLQIDHEYLLFMGGHTDCLDTPLCSRTRTIFQMFSAVFSENGQDPNIIRSKIVGTGTIIIEQDAVMEVNRGTMLGIETLPTDTTSPLMYPPITITDIALQLNDNGQVLIGSDTQAGGGLQIGNLFSKAKVFGNPSLATNAITATITIDGPGALFQVGEQGFLGFGVGLVGQFPIIPNDWGMSSLFNANQITLNIWEGVFEQKQIASGLSPLAAVLAIGPCLNYTFSLDPINANMRGGGNLATIPDGWRLQPVNILTPGLLSPGGIRQEIDFGEPVVLDYFYKRNIASTGQYTNDSFRNLLSSANQLDNRGNPNPYEFSGTDTQFTDYLAALVYIQEVQKEGAISDVDGAITIGYLDIVNSTSQFVRTTNLPLQPGQQLDFNKILNDGVIGIWVETINNQRDLITVYDVEPGEITAG